MKIGVITDVHLANPDHPPDRCHNPYDFANARGNFANALNRHRAAGVTAIAMLGDLANNGDEPHHLLGLELCEAAGLPVWIVPGNHDCEEGVSALATRIASSGSGSIRIPAPVGKKTEELRVAGLPTTFYDTDVNWTVALPDVAAWASEPALVLSHFPALSRANAAAESGLTYAGDAGNHEAIAVLLRGRSAPTVVLHGHLHLRDAVIDGPILQIGFASIIEPPHETASVEIDIEADGIVVHVRHEAIAASTAERLPILAPAVATWRFANGSWMLDSSDWERSRYA